MVRTPSFDKNGIKKGAWSPEEDSKLEAYITRYGHWNWRELPKFAGLKRCGKSCRLRWMNYLRPNVRRGNYTKQEEDLIMELHEKHGNKWAMIAGRLPGRTDNEIKNYWHTHLKKRWCSSSDNTTTSDSEKSTPRQASSRSTSFSSPNPTPTDEESLSHVNILESSSLSSRHFSSDAAAPATATASISSSTSTGEGIFEDIMSDSFALPETESTSLSDCFISPQSESTSLCDLFQPSTSHTTNCGTSMNMEPPVIESTTQGIYEVLEEDNDFWTKPFNVEDMTSSYNLGGFDHDYSIIENEQLLLSPYMPQCDQSIIDLFFDQDLPML